MSILKLSFFFLYVVPSIGKKGGLVCAWRRGISIDVISYSANIMSVLFYPSDPLQTFLCSFIYAPRISTHKQAFWDYLIQIGTTSHEPWLLIGDFNAILHNHEKRGGSVHGASSSHSGFKTTIDSLGMIDLGIFRYKYTWDYRR